MNIDLTGVKALVTGASRGIGKAIAREMIDSGASVAVHYNKSRAGAQELVDKAPGDSAIFQADLNDPAQCAGLVAGVAETFGGLDVLVNNAAVAIESPPDEPLEQCVEKWQTTLNVNLIAAGVLSREAIAVFSKSGGGRIVHIASRAAFRGDTPDYMAYAASKGGMVALSRSIARGFGKQGVKSFVIAPGFTRTEMADDFINKYGEDMAMRDMALDRMTEPGDIAPLVVFLASGLADHATGTSIDVNAASYVR